MITLGFMSLSHGHEKAYAEELAKVASDYGIRFIRFTPGYFPGSLLVKGLSFHPKSGQWNEIEREIPELIYDRCFYGRDQQSKKQNRLSNGSKSILKRHF